MTRRQFSLLLVIGAVLLAGTCVLIFGPARGARNDISDVQHDLNASRRGIYTQLEVARGNLADANRQLRLTEQSLVLQQQGLQIARSGEQAAQSAAQSTQQIEQQTAATLATVRQVIDALGPLQDLKGKIDTIVRGVEAGVMLARTTLDVAQQTLATGKAALAVAVSTLTTLKESKALQEQLLQVAKLTLEQTREINRKIPGAPVFGPSPLPSPAGR